MTSRCRNILRGSHEPLACTIHASGILSSSLSEEDDMSTFETLAIVMAVYGVVFLAHRASQLVGYDEH